MHGNVEALVFVIGCAVMLVVCVSMTFTGYPVLGASLGTLFGSMGMFTALDMRRGRGDAAGGDVGESGSPPRSPGGGPPSGTGRDGGAGARVRARPSRRPPGGRAAAAIRQELLLGVNAAVEHAARADAQR